MRRMISLAGLLSVFSLVGCGGGNNGTTVVSGKVTLPGGAPLPGGNITFEPTDAPGKAIGGQIKADGTYEVHGVPRGPCKVSIDNQSLKNISRAAPKLPAGVQAPPGMAGEEGVKYVKIDPKYAKAATSGLSTNVTGSAATYNIELSK